jgi:hypothetical protein
MRAVSSVLVSGYFPICGRGHRLGYGRLPILVYLPRARAGSTATAINGRKTVKIHVCESTVLSPLYPVEVCTLPLRCRVESGGVPPSQGHGPPRGAVHIRPATAQQSHVPSLPLVRSGLKRSFYKRFPDPLPRAAHILNRIRGSRAQFGVGKTTPSKSMERHRGHGF